MSGAATPRASGFDCSGLVKAAYAAAGVSLPRVAQDQFDTTPPLSPGGPLEPGDLVFFGANTASVDHVGLFVGVVGGSDLMVDAPHSGAVVRLEGFTGTLGRSFRDAALRRGHPPLLSAGPRRGRVQGRPMP